MRIIRLENLRDDMILAKPLFQKNGVVLLGEGAVNLMKYQQKFAQMGISHLYVEDEESKGIKIDDVVSEETRAEGRRIIGDMMDKLTNKKQVNLTAVKQLVNTIIDELLSNKTVLVNLTDLKNIDTYLYSHAVNVSILSLIVGNALQYNSKQLSYLGAGAILHDIGLAMLPKELALKDMEQMTPAEAKLYKSHPQMGYELVRSSRDIDGFSKNIIWGHHEQVDGGGYPRKLSSDTMHEMAKIVAVCDAYDDLTSNKADGRKMPSHQAIEYLIAHAGTIFDQTIVGIFVRYIAIFPTGSLVTLNDARKGIVERQNNGFPARPVVRLLDDPTYPVIDLLKEVSVAIAQCE